MTLQAKAVLLTGASGGIGQALAQQLDQAGATLWLTGRNETALQGLAAKLSRPAHIVIADLASSAGRQHLLERLGTKPLDAVVFAAGTNHFALLGDQNAEQLSQLINTNLLAPMQLTQSLLPRLSADARLLYIGSSLGAIGYPGFAAYGASKAGLRSFAQALRREWADSPRQVCHIAPRATQTEMNSAAMQQMNQQLKVKADSPQWVASQVLRQLQATHMHDQDLGYPEKLFIRINAVLPGVVDNAITGQLPVIKRYAKQNVSQALTTGEAL
ncbi:SDR family oxidoreductase [Alishewanella sp. SMS8]|uniref:SDR family oxidoreductase n=1 Tax=Alishewanella sp. SMS8 TaxID=2994676 RepID=UPI002740E45D|nr:SDR family oxidoreductase [Alishewanella sp. SMS8]MDP4945730.1 SDR family oxidoreductase [Alishewanella sp.]MDP5035190.1 SDR family oxidoreductase [Alishewanella sp.]MDP5207711.1 SDR family oxidoreductase [Alishewanella sp. SMS9]MDP5458180.1 SDR family oxidoreductase [Alishewanella sp. SMS8]